jgi:hypothetical protein
MLKEISAITAYRHPGRRVFWDEYGQEPIGKMRMDDAGKLTIQRDGNWQVIEQEAVLYTKIVSKAGKKNARTSN